MVTATKGGGRGDKRFLQAVPSNCEISHCAARIYGQKAAKYNARPRSPSTPELVECSMLACFRDTLACSRRSLFPSSPRFYLALSLALFFACALPSERLEEAKDTLIIYIEDITLRCENMNFIFQWY